MDFFFSNPQNDRVKRAVNNHLLEPDQSYNNTICIDINDPNIDTFNNGTYSEKLRNYNKSIMKRLKYDSNKQSPTQLLLLLYLIESIGQSCPVYIDYLAAPEFITLFIEICNDARGDNDNDMVTHNKPKSKQRYYTSDQLSTLGKCQQKACQLIYEWSVIYGRNGTNTYPIFTDVHTRLSNKGIKFPAQSINDIKSKYTNVHNTRVSIDADGNAVDERGNIIARTNAPGGNRKKSSNFFSSLTDNPYSNNTSPSRSTSHNLNVPSNNMSRQYTDSVSQSSRSTVPRRISSARPPRPYVAQYASVTPEYTKKIQDECAQILNYLQLLRDMLVLSQSDESDDVKTNDSIQSLFAIVHEIKTRMSRIIAEINDEYLLNLCIEYHTLIYNILIFYDQCSKKQAAEPPVLPDEFVNTMTALSVNDTPSLSTPSHTGDVLDLTVFNQTLPSATPTSTSSSSTSTVPTPKQSSTDDQQLYDYQYALNVTGTNSQQVLPTGGNQVTPFDDDSNNNTANGNATQPPTKDKKKKKKKSLSTPHKQSIRKNSNPLHDPFATEEQNIFEA